jgi:hypothetical protein
MYKKRFRSAVHLTKEVLLLYSLIILYPTTRSFIGSNNLFGFTHIFLIQLLMFHAVT